jgi:peptidoglycan/LPS O-acetylase OafA/YrhL
MAALRTRELSSASALVVVVLALPVAIAAHLAVERPARRWLRLRLCAEAA